MSKNKLLTEKNNLSELPHLSSLYSANRIKLERTFADDPEGFSDDEYATSLTMKSNRRTTGRIITTKQKTK